MYEVIAVNQLFHLRQSCWFCSSGNQLFHLRQSCIIKSSILQFCYVHLAFGICHVNFLAKLMPTCCIIIQFVKYMSLCMFLYMFWFSQVTENGKQEKHLVATVGKFSVIWNFQQVKDSNHECYRDQEGLKSCYCYKVVLKDESIVDSRFMHEKFATTDSPEAPLVVATPMKVSSFSLANRRLHWQSYFALRIMVGESTGFCVAHCCSFRGARIYRFTAVPIGSFVTWFWCSRHVDNTSTLCEDCWSCNTC